MNGSSANSDGLVTGSFQSSSEPNLTMVLKFPNGGFQNFSWTSSWQEQLSFCHDGSGSKSNIAVTLLAEDLMLVVLIVKLLLACHCHCHCQS